MSDSSYNTECAIGIDSSICSKSSLLADILSIKIEKSKIGASDTLDDLKTIYKCDKELCILTKSIDDPLIPQDVKSEINEEIMTKFKPIGPHDTTALIHDGNIRDIFYSLTSNKKYKFYAIPFQMIDFKETKSELYTFSIDKLISDGYTTAGTIVNTDVHTGKGKHWFAIFCDMRKSPVTLEYFNSSGSLPYKEILDLFTHKKQTTDAPLKCITVSRIMHQKSKTECGVYSLYYIFRRLEGDSYESFNRRVINDNEMLSFRRQLFR